uniref:probable serine/threonine-protein kinase PBL1 n=1 Tax=Erigeron canadensis TaxID=72917 RepID=UPI001CB899CB|nr:probable serine/threonine-protein kinase PBL1 [Erigeron canadensis]
MAHVKEFEHLKIKLEDIIKSTNNFSRDNFIGQGGFGPVYTGEITHAKGHTIVAFKRLNRDHGQGDPEFWKEIMMLSIYRHENIVSLLGYCDDSKENILVYEYASRKSLDQYLHHDGLTWVQRLKICIGAARGLAHLHNPQDTQLRLLHRDIKSSNILLDENWNAKISYFGLSKFGPANKMFTYFITDAVGTLGYCDPLYMESGLLTKESDVYSFGVVLFEVLCGRLCIRHRNDTQPLITMVRKYKEEKKISELIYNKIENTINPNALEVFVKIAYQCLERERKERPSMTHIVEALEHTLEIQEQIIDQVEKVDLSTNALSRQADLDSANISMAMARTRIEENAFGGFLIVTIHKAYDLQTKNPFIMLRVGHDFRKSTVVKNNRNPVWEETFKFTIAKPPTKKTTLYMVVCSRVSNFIFPSTTETMGDFDIILADVVKERHINKIYNLPKGRLHVELQWEPSASPLEPKPKMKQFLSSFYNVGIKGVRGD